jgi:hypothetical protein
MTLSEYEEMVVAELETQFSGRGGPALSWARLTAPSACLVAGVALLVAAHHGALLIRLSDLLGIATAAITSTLALAGYAVLLVGAFLLGLVVHGLRQSPARPGMERPVRRVARR